MEEDPDASESDASPVASSPPARPDLAPRRPSPSNLAVALLSLLSLSLGPLTIAPPAKADGLGRVKASATLRYGSDMEGGGPYAYPDPRSPREVTGFEVELMAMLGKELGVAAEFSQGQWDKLLQVLSAGRIDAVVNGYEWTEARAREYAATRPYYVYQLQLLAPKGSPVASWEDLKRPRPDGRRWTVGVLVGSAAERFAAEDGGSAVDVIPFDGSTDAMLAVQNGQSDATLQDVPAARFYRDRYPGLASAGPPVSRGYYVIYTRAEDASLRDALDRGLAGLTASGELRRLYEKYGIWTEAQAELDAFSGPIEVASGDGVARGWRLINQYSGLLLDAAKVTVILATCSMPLAMAIGLVVALARLHGPRALQPFLTGYVELIRGTPLMLQLYVLFFVLKLPRWVAGIGGLAINYSAYEAEIYRAGLQAIPAGQMEAALALGMSRGMALRRVIVPQAVRIVIPPVTNDFIALFKDTSVCSVVTLVELTKQYSILANSTGGALEFALAAATLYMLMSVPLSWFSRWSERRLAGDLKGGEA
ncbi:L-cystine transport system permease protein TcyB [Aquisphaera giovannonii]|uniref:L-cystine transport system permease protein TcyB n=1 Tax=Aquisphaera giovannonii TaxID=406548 RepID=A0A5B9WBF0_9BACT|nr:ABC transporter substrate-binding protein/permease [Aquisphaera giovannonii]QEH37793.1 L-cystine transport system permease protein TcyB [Aquisphaera giovannonii]